MAEDRRGFRDAGSGAGCHLQQELPRIEAALESLFAYAEQLIADRQAHPKDDFVTRLVQAQRDDDRMTHQELLDSLALLIFGGFDTTRNQLGLAIKTFLDHPDQWKLLAEHPELGGTAVEEVMRVNPAVTWVTREALDDFEFQGWPSKPGRPCTSFRSPPGPTRARLKTRSSTSPRRGRPPHFGFGGGAHHCLGHFVARSDMSVALPILARRMPDLRLGGEAGLDALSGNTGANSLPLAFSAGH